MTAGKLSTVKPTKKPKAELEKRSSSKIPSLADLIAAEGKQRQEIANRYAALGATDKVYFHPVTQKPHCLYTAYDINTAKFEALVAKKPNTLKHRVEQVYRIICQEDTDQRNQQFLIINVNASCQDYSNNVVTNAYTIGDVQIPTTWTGSDSFSPETGEPEAERTELTGFYHKFTIPYSKDLVLSLVPFFYKTSLVVKSRTGRKYTIEAVEDFVTEDFDKMVASHTPRRTMEDGSVR